MSANYKEIINNCDERIARIQVRIDFVEDSWKAGNNVLSFIQQTLDLNNEDRQKFNIKPPNKNKHDLRKLTLSIIKVERLIYTSLKNKADKSLFPRLLAKYDELMGLTYDVVGNIVLENEFQEGEYLDYCKRSLEQREYIKKLCEVGVDGVKIFL